MQVIWWFYPYINKFYILKRQASQTPYLYYRVSLIWAWKYSTLHTNVDKMVSRWHPKVIPKCCERWPIWVVTTSDLLHPFWTTTFIINHFIFKFILGGGNMRRLATWLVSRQVERWLHSWKSNHNQLGTRTNNQLFDMNI